jgi:hypothetical protein
VVLLDRDLQVVASRGFSPRVSSPLRTNRHDAERNGVEKNPMFRIGRSPAEAGLPEVGNGGERQEELVMGQSTIKSCRYRKKFLMNISREETAGSQKTTGAASTLL